MAAKKAGSRKGATTDTPRVTRSPRATRATRTSKSKDETASASPKPMRTRLEVDERRAQLLAVGMEMFGSKDYDDVSLDDMARTLGISKGLVYHYFPTKKDFFSATVEAAAEKLLEMTEPDTSLAPGDRLREGITAYLRFVEEYRAPFVALMRGRASGDIAKILERTRQRMIDRIIDSTPFAKKDDPRLLLALRGWIGFVEALSLEWAARDDVPMQEPLDLALQTFATCIGYVAQSWGNVLTQGAVAAVRGAERFLGLSGRKR